MANTARNKKGRRGQRWERRTVLAEQAECCSDRTIKYIRKNLRQFGNVHAPTNRVGRFRTITAGMLEILCDHLVEKPALYLDEMAVFLWDEFGIWLRVYRFELRGLSLLCRIGCMI